MEILLRKILDLLGAGRTRTANAVFIGENLERYLEAFMAETGF